MAPPKASSNGAISSPSVTARWTNAALSLFRFLYGLLVVVGFVIRSRFMNPKFRQMDHDEKRQLAEARDRLWNLQKQPLGLNHAFCRLRHGVKLHYVYSRPSVELKGKTGLVIFLHGFPDSWYLWHLFLKSSELKNTATLVALDLPGYGGSDDLDVYDADHVLEVVSEFIIKMRDMYASADDNGQAPVVVVGHDWGALIGFRLAAEAPVLADRFILSNSLHPPLIQANIQNRVAFIGQMLKTWVHNPTNIRPLHHCLTNAKPLWSQIRKSGYVFAFALPWPLPNILGRIGNFWMFRILNAFGDSNNPTGPLTSTLGLEILASSIGPGQNEFDTELEPGNKPVDPLDPDEHLKYPISIKSRASTGGWFEKLRLYRENLIASPWNKSLQLVWELNQIEQTHASISSSSSTTASSMASSAQKRRGSNATSKTVGVFDIGPPGSLAAATTVIWGAKDVALNTALATEGIADYFGVRESHFVVLPQVGHWTPLSTMAFGAWKAIVSWAVQGEEGPLKDKLTGFPAAEIKISS